MPNYSPDDTTKYNEKTNAQLQKECGEFCSSLTNDDINKITQAVLDHHEFL